MRKFLIIFIGIIIIGIAGYFALMYYATYSEGNRSGELIKFSNKGYVFKTWEGELSQGISGAQIFKFSIMDSEEKIIENMKELQGDYVKITYVERYKTFPWWGETKYYVIAVEKDSSPFKIK